MTIGGLGVVSNLRKRCKDCGDLLDESGAGKRCYACYLNRLDRFEEPLAVDEVMRLHRGKRIK